MLMISGESALFCDECPRRDSCIGPISELGQYTVSENFFSLNEINDAEEISLATIFQDNEGREADYFPPDTELEDIANCNGIETDYRTGFLNLRQVKDCGAFVAAIHRFRMLCFGSPYPPKE